MKKLLVVGVIVLFLGLACAPSINANVSRDSELVEVTTEICGLGGGKHTVQLTQEEVEEVEQLFDDIERRLAKVETREETVEIFNDAIVELDKYGLLDVLSIKQMKKLLICKYNNLKLNDISNILFNKLPKNTSNFLCLIAGATNGTNFDGQPELLCGRLSVLLSFIGPILFKKFPLYILFILGYFILNIFSSVNPISLASRINLGGEKGGGYHPEFIEYYAHGWIITIGLFGKHRNGGKMLGAIPLCKTGTISEGIMYIFNPGVIGFTGIHISIPSKSKHFYLGSALWINLEEI